MDNFLLHMYQEVKLHHPMICACSIGDKSLMIPSKPMGLPLPLSLASTAVVCLFGYYCACIVLSHGGFKNISITSRDYQTF